jgi:catechol 2,3-dioxygenase-like lactoylglutathione lyase family enzyme
MSNTPFTLGEVGYAVDDLEAEVKFYERLGFSRLEQTTSNPAEHAMMYDGHALIGLYKLEFTSPTIGFYLHDPEAEVERLKETGIDLEVERKGDTTFIAAYFTSPNGVPVQIASLDWFNHPGKADQTTSKVGTFGEFAIGVEELEPALDFWKKAGFPILGGPFEGPPMKWAILGSKDFPIGLHEYPGPAPHAPTFFHTNQKALIAQLREEGVPVTWEMAGPSGEIEHAWVETPNGYTVFLFTRRVTFALLSKHPSDRSSSRRADTPGMYPRQRFPAESKQSGPTSSETRFPVHQ